MAIGRPDYFSMPTTPRFGNRATQKFITLYPDPGEALSSKIETTGVLRGFAVDVTQDTPGKTDLMYIEVDGEWIHYGIFDRMACADNYRWAGAVWTPLHLDYLTGRLAFKWTGEFTFQTSLEFFVYSEATQTDLKVAISVWYDEIVVE
jgi:hypothetical protein